MDSRTPSSINYIVFLFISFPFLLGVNFNSTLSKPELYPEKKHIVITELINHIMNTYHYNADRYNKISSNDLFNNYLISLDENKDYFTSDDINQLNIYQQSLIESLNDSDLVPVYKIFSIFKKRVTERSNYIKTLLKNDFDFNIDEEYSFNRQNLSWLNKNELNDHWRKRIKNDYLNLKLNINDKDKIVGILIKRYDHYANEIGNYNSNDVFNIFINSYIKIADSFSQYYPPLKLNDLDIKNKLSLVGVGIVLDSNHGFTHIKDIISGSSASLSKQISSGDRIIGIGQGDSGKIVDVIGWRLDDIVELLRGKQGSTIRLQILPAGQIYGSNHKIVTLERNKVKLEEQVASMSYINIDDTNDRIGVITIPSFYVDFQAQATGNPNYKSVSRDVKKLINKLNSSNVNGLIIDIRGNGGGALSEIFELASLFLKEGPAVQTKDAKGRIDINSMPKTNPEIPYTGPLAVLIDRHTASGAEMFAATIQDYKRGVLVGEQSYGHGIVANIIDLNRFVKNDKSDHGKLKSTIAQMYRLNGDSIQVKGVMPDLLLSTSQYNDSVGIRFLKNSTPWNTIKPARYFPASAPVEKINEAIRKYQISIEENPEYKTILEIEKLKAELNSTTSISLMLSKREKDRSQYIENIKTTQVDIVLVESARMLNELVVPKFDKPNIQDLFR